MSKKHIGYLLKNINDKQRTRADADLKRYHLTLAQSRVIAFLNAKGGAATQKEIELFLEVSHPTVVGIVSRMEQNGHVTSWMDAKDKRNKIVQVTDEAKAIRMELEKNMLASEQRMMQSFSEEEVEKLRGMLTTICNNLD